MEGGWLFPVPRRTPGHNPLLKMSPINAQFSNPTLMSQSTGTCWEHTLQQGEKLNHRRSTVLRCFFQTYYQKVWPLDFCLSAFFLNSFMAEETLDRPSQRERKWWRRAVPNFIISAPLRSFHITHPINSTRQGVYLCGHYMHRRVIRSW